MMIPWWVSVLGLTGAALVIVKAPTRTRMEITVKGKNHTWAFEFIGDPKHLETWRKDGLEVDEICNTIPLWLPARLIRVWCFAQDVLNFKRRK